MIETEIGLPPSWSTSGCPGVRMYLQTKTLRSGSVVVVLPRTVVDGPVDEVVEDGVVEDVVLEAGEVVVVVVDADAVVDDIEVGVEVVDGPRGWVVEEALVDVGAPVVVAGYPDMPRSGSWTAMAAGAPTTRTLSDTASAARNFMGGILIGQGVIER